MSTREECTDILVCVKCQQCRIGLVSDICHFCVSVCVGEEAILK